MEFHIVNKIRETVEDMIDASCLDSSVLNDAEYAALIDWCEDYISERLGFPARISKRIIDVSFHKKRTKDGIIIVLKDLYKIDYEGILND